MNARKRTVDNDAWVRSHFGMIVDRFGGKYPYVLVAGGKVFPLKAGEDVQKLEEKIKRKYGRPIGMPVPQPEDFHSILFAKLQSK